jgi:hypothetical protein
MNQRLDAIRCEHGKSCCCRHVATFATVMYSATTLVLGGLVWLMILLCTNNQDERQSTTALLLICIGMSALALTMLLNDCGSGCCCGER